jgi:hypothetical protein
MSFAEVNGSAVTRGRFTFRLQGAWDAEIEVSTTDPADVTGAVTITVGGTTLHGTAAVVGADRGNLVSLRVAAGAAGLSTVLAPQDSGQAVSRRQLVQAILAGGGEALSGTADASVLDAQVPRWSRLAGTVGDALWAVVERAGAVWRTLPDGTIWVGKDTWSKVEETGVVVEDESPQNKRLDVALEDLLVLPGSSFAGHNISTAHYTVDGSRMRAALYYDQSRGALEELLGSAIQRETAHHDLKGKYLCKAVGQNADGSLELKPYLADIPPLSKVKARPGIPGMTTYKIVVGLDVILEFENGANDGAVVTSFAPGAAQELAFAALIALRLGSDSASDEVVTANRLIQAFATHTHPVPALGTSGVPTAPLTNIGSPKVFAD